MVVLLSTVNGRGHIDGFVNTYDRSYGRTMQETTYEDLLARGAAPPAAYLFGDGWRMNAMQKQLAVALWDQLARHGDSVRLLNHPGRQLGRFELLRALHQDGVNSFNVYRLGELSDSVRYPVFVRLDSDHMGAMTELLETREDVERSLIPFILNGVAPERLMVVEYEHIGGSDGMYRKYAALRIGDQIIAHHVMLSRGWNTKRHSRIRTDEAIDESDAYSLSNPHAERLMPIFERAGVEYGRIDYAVKGKSIEVWEINDNPVFMHLGERPHSRIERHQWIKAAFDQVGQGLPRSGAIPIDLAGPDLWNALHEWGAHVT